MNWDESMKEINDSLKGKFKENKGFIAKF
jgi:hypothetical protein